MKNNVLVLFAVLLLISFSITYTKYKDRKKSVPVVVPLEIEQSNFLTKTDNDLPDLRDADITFTNGQKISKQDASELLKFEDCSECSETPKDLSEVFFEDAFLKKCIQVNQAYYENGITDLNALTDLRCNGEGVLSIKGLENFPNLSKLALAEIPFDTLDLSEIKKLEGLEIFDGNLSSIDVSKNVYLKSLELFNLKINKIDLTKNTELTYLTLYNNELSSIDLSKNTKLSYLQIRLTKLKKLDLSANKLLEKILVEDNPMLDKKISKGLE